MSLKGIGVDMIEVARFRSLRAKAARRFFDQTFSEAEQKYCLSYRDSAPHFAGTFAAKEAVRKASGNFVIPLRALEVRRDTSGKPQVWFKGKRLRSLVVSITHTRTIACAVAFNKSL